VGGIVPSFVFGRLTLAGWQVNSANFANLQMRTLHTLHSELRILHIPIYHHTIILSNYQDYEAIKLSSCQNECSNSCTIPLVGRKKHHALGALGMVGVTFCVGMLNAFWGHFQDMFGTAGRLWDSFGLLWAPAEDSFWTV